MCLNIKFTFCCTHITVEVTFRKWGGFFFVQKAVNFAGSIAQCDGLFQVYWIVSKKYWLLSDIYTQKATHIHTRLFLYFQES